MASPRVFSAILAPSFSCFLFFCFLSYFSTASDFILFLTCSVFHLCSLLRSSRAAHYPPFPRADFRPIPARTCFPLLGLRDASLSHFPRLEPAPSARLSHPAIPEMVVRRGSERTVVVTSIGAYRNLFSNFLRISLSRYLIFERSGLSITFL